MSEVERFCLRGLCRWLPPSSDGYAVRREVVVVVVEVCDGYAKRLHTRTQFIYIGRWIRPVRLAGGQVGGWAVVRKRGAYTKPDWAALYSTGLLSAASGEEGHKRNKRNTVASMERTV